MGDRVAFLAGRDPGHPQAGGGDHQAWVWASRLAAKGADVAYVCQSAPGLRSSEQVSGVRVVRVGTGLSPAVRAWRGIHPVLEQVDLIYEDPIGSGRTPYLSPLYVDVPIIAVWHQVSEALLRAMMPRSAAVVLGLSERVIARAYHRTLLWVPSEERATEVCDILGFDRDRVHVIPPTIPSQWLADRPRMPGPPRFLVLGLIRRYKLIDDAIRGFALVAQLCPDADLVVAGRRKDGAYERELRHLAADLGIADRVEFHFNVNADVKRALIRSATAMVLPSLLEGFGIVALEANALGVPVIASDGVPVASVTHGRNGLRYPCGNHDALADHMGTLLRDAALLSRLSTQSLATARSFTTDAVGQHFDRLVERALRDGKS